MINIRANSGRVLDKCRLRAISLILSTAGDKNKLLSNCPYFGVLEWSSSVLVFRVLPAIFEFFARFKHSFSRLSISFQVSKSIPKDLEQTRKFDGIQLLKKSPFFP